MRRCLVWFLILTLLASPAHAQQTLGCAQTSTIYTYDSMLADIDILQAEGMTVQTIGYSLGGEPIKALYLGTGDVYALALAGVHGNENANPAMLMRAMAELFARAQSGDEAVLAVLNRCTLVAVPCVNPDGYIRCVDYVSNGRVYYQKGNLNEVNLNRNFPTPYWGSDAVKGDKNYAGPSAGSEPETQAVVALMKKHNYGAMTDIHSKGKQVYCGKGGFVQSDLLTSFPVETLDNMTYILAKALVPEGYRTRPQAAASRDGGFGSSTDYAFHLGYPGVTIETISMNQTGPITPQVINREYEQINMPQILLNLCGSAVYFSRQMQAAAHNETEEDADARAQ